MRLRTLGQQLTHWALALRKPWFQLLFQATREFFPISLLGVPEFKRPAPWIADSYVRRNRRALMGYEPRVKLCGAPPSFQHNLSTLDMLRRQLGCSAPSSHPLYEKRYPYLDRRLLEFLYAIPREQIVRPHQRRSLMRRALAGIVPEEILQRKRKASCARGPMSTVSITWARLSGTNSQMITADLGIIDPAPFLQFLRKTLRGESVPLVAVLRTLYVEDWLRNSLSGGTLAGRPSGWLTLQKTPTDQALS
jgi:asparagine synthase (glutamine-hydrolysing)